MKRIFTCIFTVLCSLAATATDYNDRLTVIINGAKTEQNATISVDRQPDGRYTLSLENFILTLEGQQMPVGNIVLKDIEGTQLNSTTELTTGQDITITEGTTPGVDFWTGPSLGPVPVKMAARINGNRLKAAISIYMAALEQHIDVVFGKDDTGYQIANADFENFRKEGSTDEPLAWHSFGSASGKWASMAGKHCRISTDTRTGTGKCASIYATSIFGIIANGTMTTGRMNAGAINAADKANHAYIDMSIPGIDSNGDPFYTPLGGRPDSLALWINFKQATPNATYPYATVSAAITNGTYYQDPEDKAYTNVVAKARNNTIATTGGQWKRIAIPFEYIDRTIDGKALLVTISTNAVPGKGAHNDEILVDDIELIYSTRLSTLTIAGQPIANLEHNKTEYRATANRPIVADDIQAVATNEKSLIVKTVGPVSDRKQTAEITVFGEDLRTSTTYRVEISLNTTGIATVEAPTTPRTEIYNIQGQRVRHMRHGQVYIVKQADGRTRKVIK